MVLLNSRITLLDETHLNINSSTYFWIESGELCLIFDICCLWRSASHVFIRLILPVLIFEAVSCTKNVELE